MEQEIAFKLQDSGIRYLTQVEIPVTTADFYFPLEPRPLLVFVDGRVHHGTAQMVKTKSYGRSYGREDTGYWNCTTITTQTKRETSYTRKSLTA